MMSASTTSGGVYGTALEMGPSSILDGGPGNPGTRDFSEDDLHEPQYSLYEQVIAMIYYLSYVKLTLLVLVPFLGFLCWKGNELSHEESVSFLYVEAALFLVALLAVVPCSVLLVEFLEDIVIRLDNEALGTIVNVVFEHASEILFSLFSLIVGGGAHACYIKPVLLGCVLLNLLVVLGGCIVIAPPSDRLVAFGVSAWSLYTSGLVFTTVAFLFPTLYDLTIATPAMTKRAARHPNDPASAMKEEETSLLLISRGLSLFVLVVYVLYLVKVFRSIQSYYTSDGNPNAPTSLSYAVQYREVVQAGSRAPSVLSPRFSLSFMLFGATLSLVLLAVLCYLLVICLDSTIRVTSLRLPFLLVVLLPVVFGMGGLGAGLVMSYEGRLDIGASIALSSTMHIFVCVLPSIVLLAWATGTPLHLSFDPFLAWLCFISVLAVTQLVSVNRVRWLEGSILLALYLLIVCACLLGGWKLCAKV